MEAIVLQEMNAKPHRGNSVQCTKDGNDCDEHETSTGIVNMNTFSANGDIDQLFKRQNNCDTSKCGVGTKASSSDESEQIVWKCSVASSSRDNSAPLSSKLEQFVSGIQVRSVSSPCLGNTTRGCAEECGQHERCTGPPSSPSSSSSSSLPSLKPSPMPSPVQSNTCPHHSPPSSPLFNDSRPPKPQMDLLPKHYWVFIDKSNRWVQVSRWESESLEPSQPAHSNNTPRAPPDPCPPSAPLSPQYNCKSGYTDGARKRQRHIQQEIQNLNMVSFGNKKQKVSNEEYSVVREFASPRAGDISTIEDTPDCNDQISDNGESIHASIHQHQLRKERKGCNPDADVNISGKQLIVNTNTNVNIPKDVEDLRRELSNYSIASFMALLIHLARQDNRNAGFAVAAINRLLDDEVPFLPKRSELGKFHFYEHTLTELIQIVSAQAGFSEMCNVSHEINLSHIPSSPTSHQAPPHMEGPFLFGDNSHGEINHRDSNHGDKDQGHRPPSEIPNSALPPLQQPDPNSKTIFRISPDPLPLSGPISAKELCISEVAETVRTDFNKHVGSLYTYNFIITESKMYRASNRVPKKLAQRWITQANKRITLAIGTGIQLQLEGIRVDGKYPTERIVRVTSTMVEIEAKEHLLKSLSGWNSVEMVFQEGEYPEWVLMGVPITSRSHPQDIVESIAQLTNINLGARRPTFLIRRATTGNLRFSTILGDNPPKTIELNGKSLHIVTYESYQHPQGTYNIEKPEVTASEVTASKVENLDILSLEPPPHPIMKPPITACFKCRKSENLTIECPRRTGMLPLDRKY